MKKFITCLLSALGLTTGCGQQNFENVDVKAFSELIEEPGVVLLDVRTPEEYSEGHIEKAINIDVMNNNFETTAMSILPQNKTIALYCRSGNRSKKAAEILAEKGYKVVELNSGYKGWKAFKEQR